MRSGLGITFLSEYLYYAIRCLLFCRRFHDLKDDIGKELDCRAEEIQEFDRAAERLVPDCTNGGTRPWLL
jgi:hypothetical protein